jgi:ferritin-like metal-binding protein YciE
MRGLVNDWQRVIDSADADPSVRDAALICAAQKTHERAADTMLTHIAENWVNLAAAQPQR